VSNIINFPGSSESPVRQQKTVESAERSSDTKYQRASSKRNPLRRLYSQAGIAVTIAGKLHRGEPLRANSHFDEKEWLRQGAEAARLLADELARLVEPEGAPEQLSTAERIARAGARFIHT
jgi:uncharacterized protein (DUF1501 family)